MIPELSSAPYETAIILAMRCYFDLFESGQTSQLHVLNDQFVEIPPPSETGPGPYKINSVGDILMDRGGIVVNPFLNVAYQVPGASELDGGKDINDHGTVLLGSQQSGGALRSNIHDPNSAEWFPEANLLADPEINNLDEFCARQDVSSGKPRHRVNQYAVRYGSTQVDWYSDPFEVLATNGINDSGDICGEGNLRSNRIVPALFQRYRDRNWANSRRTIVGHG